MFKDVDESEALRLRPCQYIYMDGRTPYTTWDSWNAGGNNQEQPAEAGSGYHESDRRCDILPGGNNQEQPAEAGSGYRESDRRCDILLLSRKGGGIGLARGSEWVRTTSGRLYVTLVTWHSDGKNMEMWKWSNEQILSYRT